MKKTKRALCAALAGVMLLALAIPAFKYYAARAKQKRGGGQDA